MKSKISFFNKTIFKKNVALYWPLWAAYLLAFLVFQPIALWFTFENGNFYERYTLTDKIEDLIYTYSGVPMGWFIVIAAVLIGMALYSYIYNAKSANMIHALPVDKTQLFGTNVLSGLAFLIVPQVLSAIVSAGVCLGYGVNRLDVIGIALVETIAVAFVAYAIVTFCAMFTGLLVALPIYVLIFNYLGSWIYFMIYFMVNLFAYGVSSLGSGVRLFFDTYLEPLSSLADYIGIGAVYENEVSVGVEIFCGWLLAIYVAVAVVLYVIAYFTYKKRHIEQAGEWITVEWLKPVFRLGAGMTAGIYGGVFFYIMVEEIGVNLNGVALGGIMLVLGAIGFFLAEMLIRKNFHVFQKKTWIRCGIFTGILLVSYVGLHMAAEYAENYVPEKDEVKEVSIHMGYDIEMDGEMADRAIEIHEIIIKNMDELEAKAEGYHSDEEPYQYFYISYRLKTGEYIDRHYTLYAINDEVKSIVDELAALERDPEIFLQNKFCDRYEEVSVFGESHMEIQFTKDIVGKEPDGHLGYAYETIVFTPEQAKEVYAAVIADAKTGNLVKYNTNSDWSYEEIKDNYTVSMYLYYMNPDDQEDGTIVFYEGSGSMTTDDMIEYAYQNMYSVYLNIGKDCENVINKLIELGFIESVDDIYWGETEE